MFKRLNETEKRNAWLLALAGAAVLVGIFGRKGLDHWATIRQENTRMEQKLEDIRRSGPQRAGLLSLVPVFEMPTALDQRKYEFQERLHRQIKEAGLKGEPLQIESVSSKPGAEGFRRLNLKAKGKGQIGQIMDLLVSFKANPYLAGVEAFSIKCDPKKPPKDRQEVDWELVVSTFVK